MMKHQLKCVSSRICKPEVRGSIPLCSNTKTEGQINVLAFFVGLTGMRPA